jgi:light-regulated signal transduction histidine kinase (bacteriophytochrome)
VIINETQRMGALIDDLLSFSRLSRKEIQSTRIDMKALVYSVYGELTREEQRERIDFKIGRLPAVEGDPALMHQVWVNLLSNALKFSSRKDRAIIEVGTKKSDDENIYYVRDNGAGFDIQYVDKLFGVFQRLHSDDEFEGTGVGLAIVQRVIQRHGGRVWAEGDVDNGATFYFALPRERENHE